MDKGEADRWIAIALEQVRLCEADKCPGLARAWAQVVVELKRYALGIAAQP